jgi:acetate kinase
MSSRGPRPVLGVRIDPAANAGYRTALHAEGSAVAVLVVPTDEERVIARHVGRVLATA